MFLLSRLSFPSTALAVAALAPAVFAAPAVAEDVPPQTCERQWSYSSGEVLSTPLVDRLGYAFETTGNWNYDPESTYPTAYGALYEGRTFADTEPWSTSGLPVHGTDSGDAFDAWGQLFVGGMDIAHQYTDDNLQGCTPTADGRGLVYAPTTIGGLQVQRTLSVPDGTNGGARFIDTLHNPSAAPITTDVYVGDLTYGNPGGDLGSDSSTRVGASSNGDQAASREDTWFVTSDGRDAGSDPSIAFIAGGTDGARDRLAVAQVGGPSLDGQADHVLAEDQVGYGWKSVTIAPGETATFASWTLLRTAPTRAAADGEVLAAAAAQALQNGPLSEVFAGLTAEQISGVRNWPLPRPSGVTLTVTGQPLTGQALSFSATIGDATGGVAVCGAATTLWQFADGSTETGLTATRVLPAGENTVKATTVNACGGRDVAELKVTVAAPAAAPAPSPNPAPVPAAAPFQAQAPKAVRRGALLQQGLQLTAANTQPGRLRIVLQGKGVKIVKTANFKKPSGKRKVKVNFARKHARALRRLKRLKLITTFTAADGTVTRSSRDLRLK